jgi:hypothetical protein
MFELVNPIIAGNITTKFDVSEPMDAANKFWETMTTENNLIVNEVFKFIFTLRDSNDKYYHFSVIEKEKSKGNVEYKLEDITKEVEEKANTNDMNQFKKEVSRVKEQIEGTNKKGGKKKSSSSSSSSSSDDDDDDDDFDFAKVRRRMYNTPISYWWYSPMIYKVRRIFTPVFVKPIAPYVQLWMPM